METIGHSAPSERSGSGGRLTRFRESRSALEESGINPGLVYDIVGGDGSARWAVPPKSMSPLPGGDGCEFLSTSTESTGRPILGLADMASG